MPFSTAVDRYHQVSIEELGTRLADVTFVVVDLETTGTRSPTAAATSGMESVAASIITMAVITPAMLSVRGVRDREFEQIAEVIAGRINKVPGVLETETHIAFRAYSRHDLDAAFSIGFETSD